MRWFAPLLCLLAAVLGGWGWWAAAQLPAGPSHVVAVPAGFAAVEQVSRVTGAAVVRISETEVHFAVPGAASGLYREWLVFLSQVAREPLPLPGSDSVLVRFGANVTGADALVFEHVTGARFVRRWTGLDAWEYTVPDGVRAWQFEQWLRLSPWVEWIGPNETVGLGLEETLIGY